MSDMYEQITGIPPALPSGFRAAAICAGMKPSGTLDMALVAADHAVPCAGVFTRSMVKAAPVRYCQQHVRKGTARAVFTNSGVANAATGEQGLRDTEATAEAVAMVLMCDPDDVMVCSTGVIGRRVAMDKLLTNVPALANKLHVDGFEEAARAIMTTDTRPKSTAWRIAAGKTEATLVGMAKGSGMIAPNMATMLSYLFTDLAVEPAALQSALNAAVRDTFNCVTVDGDTSTNDTLLIFANGAAGNPPIAKGSAEYAAFESALHAACDDLARQVARDGEGATKLVEICVDGAPSFAAARHIALTVANSPLVKTAIYGSDPNYGRLIMAVGRAGIPIEESCLTLRCGEITMLQGGQLAQFDAAAAHQYLSGDEVRFTITVGTGPGSARALTCDLSTEYVRFNAEYTT